DKGSHFKGTLVAIWEAGNLEKAEKSVAKSDGRLQALFTHNPVPLFVWKHAGEDLEFIAYNQAAAKMTRGRVKEFIGKKAGEISMDARDVFESVTECARNGIPGAHEISCRSAPTGETKPLKMTYVPLPPDSVLVHAQDVTRHKMTEESLRNAEKQLELKNSALEETNTALEVLLQNEEGQRSEVEEEISSRIKEDLEPFLNKLDMSRLSPEQRSLVRTMRSNLREILFSLGGAISSKRLGLTSTEAQVAACVREGKTSKEIADLMKLSYRTVEAHRASIRKRLGLSNKSVNLRTWLLCMEE
ncbi:LuxR C-terminal-related transcriptional regulator, partial [Thermodesulfobacteriota bacterium]